MADEASETPSEATPASEKNNEVIVTVIVATVDDVTVIRHRGKMVVQDRLVERLGPALSSLIRGMLSMCANCKRIKTDEGVWLDLEKFLRKHLGQECSHGICPKCVLSLYRDTMSPERIAALEAEIAESDKKVKEAKK